MTNLKEEFRSWLINQGLPSKGKTGKNSTVYDYLRYIDKAIKLLYEGSDWEVLVEEFPYVWLFYLLNGKNKYKQNTASFEEISQFLNENTHINIKNDLMQDFKIYKAKEQSYIQKLNNINENRKTGAAVSKFYRFLLETRHLSSHKFDDYVELANRIVECCIQINNITVISETANSPKQIKTKNSVLKDVSLTEFAQFLECSVQNALRLIKTEKINRTVSDINNYLHKHYHPSTKRKSDELNILSAEWYTIEKACEILHCSKTTIKRLMKDGYLGYTDYTPRKIKLLAEDVNALIGLDIRKNHIE